MASRRGVARPDSRVRHQQLRGSATRIWWPGCVERWVATDEQTDLGGSELSGVGHASFKARPSRPAGPAWAKTLAVVRSDAGIRPAPFLRRSTCAALGTGGVKATGAGCRANGSPFYIAPTAD